jgi:hypothetical protein
MSIEDRTGVLLLSLVPEAHSRLLEALRHRGIPADVARSGRHALRKLRSRHALVLVDLVHGTPLDGVAVARLNAMRCDGTVLGLHDGDLSRFAAQLEGLVVDGFCRAGEWTPIVTLATAHFGPGASSALH